MQGEAYAEDDSCAAIDHATQAAGMHVGASNDLKWQQDFDFTTGFYYYYRVGTQVRTSTCKMCCSSA